MSVRVIGPRDFRPPRCIDTTSRSRNWSRGLSPFLVGPVPLYKGAGIPQAQNLENVWQFCKVYKPHTGDDGDPTSDYFEWARSGWADKKAHRYPLGKETIPLYSWWDGERLDYIQARKRIYIPLYAATVIQTEAFKRLLNLYRMEGDITLWDFDGYDYSKMGLSIRDVVNNPKRKMGHAFVIAHLLEKMA